MVVVVVVVVVVVYGGGVGMGGLKQGVQKKNSFTWTAEGISLARDSCHDTNSQKDGKQRS